MLRKLISGDQALREVAQVLDTALLPELTELIMRWVLAIPDYANLQKLDKIKRDRDDYLDIRIISGRYSFNEWHCGKCREVERSNIWGTGACMYRNFKDCRCKKKEERAGYRVLGQSIDTRILKEFWTGEKV